MGWRLPPAGIRSVVNRAFGTDMYARLQDAWQAAVADSLPGPEPAYRRVQQTRFHPPEMVTGSEGPVSATSCHYLGLCFDVGGLTPEAKAKLAEQLAVTRVQTAHGPIQLAVEGMVRGQPWKPGAMLPPGHLHWGVASATLQALGMIPQIQARVAELRARYGIAAR